LVTREGIIVEVEQSVKLNVAMPFGILEEQVTVIGQSLLVDVRSTVKGMTMIRVVFESLPRGGDFDTLVVAAPGVQKEPLLSGISVDSVSFQYQRRQRLQRRDDDDLYAFSKRPGRYGFGGPDPLR
jgi:hypothetical protein